MRIVIVTLLLFLGSKPVVWTGNEQLINGYGALMIGVPIVMFIFRLFAPGGIKVIVVESRPRRRWFGSRSDRLSNR